MFYESIEKQYAGKYRDIDVIISGSKYPVAETKSIQAEMDGLFIELLEKAHRDDKPFEQFIAEQVIEPQKEIMRLLHMP